MKAHLLLGQGGIYINGKYMNITDKLLSIKGSVEVILKDAKTGKIKFDEHYTNMFVTAGKNAIADALRGNTVNNRGIVTYCAVGTGITAPALANTTLETELFRKLISVRSATANVALFETFYTTSEAIGTLKEAGLFGDDATSTADSGTLFCRVAINRTKTANDTLTLRWGVTIG